MSSSSDEGITSFPISSVPSVVISVRAALDKPDPALLTSLLGSSIARVIGTGLDRSIEMDDVTKLAGLCFCPLCNGILRKATFLTTCETRHYFCSSCTWSLLETARSTKCPSCAVHFTAAHIMEDTVMNSIVVNMFGEPKRKAGVPPSPPQKSTPAAVISRGGGGAGATTTTSYTNTSGGASRGGSAKTTATTTTAAAAAAQKRGRAAFSTASSGGRKSGGGGGSDSEDDANPKSNSGGGGGVGGGAHISERYSYRISEPVPSDFPCPNRTGGVAAMNLNVAITQSVGKHRNSALPRILKKNALKKGLVDFSATDWELKLSCEGVLLENDDESLAGAVRRVHLARGNLTVANRPEGESGQNPAAPDLARRAPPLADLVITATRRVGNPKT